MHLPASYLATINSLVPLITVCARRAFFGTIPTKKTSFAVLIGTFGVVLVVGLGPLRFSEEIFISCLASIGAAICYSLSGIFVIHFFKNESLIALSFMSLISAFIILTPINYFTLDQIPEFSLEGFIFLGDFRSFLYRPSIPIIFSSIKIFWSYGFIQCYVFCSYVRNVMGCSILGRGYYMANRYRLCCNTYSEHCNFSGRKSSMKIVLIRHGQTDWNKKKNPRSY